MRGTPGKFWVMWGPFFKISGVFDQQKCWWINSKRDEDDKNPQPNPKGFLNPDISSAQSGAVDIRHALHHSRYVKETLGKNRVRFMVIVFHMNYGWWNNKSCWPVEVGSCLSHDLRGFWIYPNGGFQTPDFWSNHRSTVCMPGGAPRTLGVPWLAFLELVGSFLLHRNYIREVIFFLISESWWFFSVLEKDLKLVGFHLWIPEKNDFGAGYPGDYFWN